MYKRQAPALGASSTTHEVHLTARATQHVVADALSIDLTEQVDFQTRIDREMCIRDSNDVVEPYAKKFGAQFFAGKKPWEHKVEMCIRDRS